MTVNIYTTKYICIHSSYEPTTLAPGVPELLKEFEAANTSLASLAVSVNILDFCVGPLFLAAFSEYYDRLFII